MSDGSTFDRPTPDSNGPAHDGHIRNGIDVDEITGAAERTAAAAGAVPVTVRTRHRWDDGAAIDGHGEHIGIPALDESLDRTHRRFRTDVPVVFGGRDGAPAPGETLLAALAGCVGATFVQTASLEGLDLDELEVSVEASFDLRGAFDLDGVRAGISGIAITLGVRADADDDTLERLGGESVRLSPTADSLAHPVPITLGVERVARTEPARSAS